MGARFEKKLRFSAVGGEQLGFFVCAVCFLAGILCGAAASGRVSAEDSLFLSDWLSSDPSVLVSGPTLAGALLRAFGYHLAVVALAFSAPGFVLIPLIAGLRGFFLSFAASSVASVSGPGAAMAVFGPSALAAVPSLLFLSSLSFAGSLSLASALASRSPLRREAGFFRRSALCVPALLASAFLDMYLEPFLASILM